jgi:hypothetical protein
MGHSLTSRFGPRRRGLLSRRRPPIDGSADPVKLLSPTHRGRGGVDDHVVTGKSNGQTHLPIARNITVRAGDACSSFDELSE